MYHCPKHQLPLEAKTTKYGTRWGCPADGCTVACWGGQTGTPADEETRQLRKQCHELFDPMWRGWDTPFGRVRCKSRVPNHRRPRAYRWLSEQMGTHYALTHFGMFQKAECLRALEILKKGVDLEQEAAFHKEQLAAHKARREVV